MVPSFQMLHLPQWRGIWHSSVLLLQAGQSAMGLVAQSSLCPVAFYPFCPFNLEDLIYGQRCPGKKECSSNFFHVIFVLWTIRNDSKHESRKPSLVKAKLILMDRLQGLANYSSSAGQPPLPVPHLQQCSPSSSAGLPSLPVLSLQQWNSSYGFILWDFGVPVLFLFIFCTV